MSRLNPDLEARYKLTLANAAKELTIGESLPVNVERVCAKLQIEHGRKIHSNKTALLAGKSRVYLPLALLPPSSHYSAKERYVIAHEIGHLILTSLCSATPLGSSEYWQFENLCDSFARQLLIPEHILNKFPDSIDSPREALEISLGLASDALVTWPTAAWRVAERYPEFAFLHVTIRRNQFGQLTMKVSASTLPRKQLQKKILTTQVGLGLMLAPLTQGKEAFSFCDNEYERSEIMTELAALGEVDGAYAMRSRGICVAFHLKR